MMFTFGKQKFKTSTMLKRASRFLIVFLLLLVFVPSVFANTGTIHLSSTYNYRSVTYNTYIKWASDLYGDSINYGLGSDSHINFTNFSMGSASNPSWTFGVVSQNGNVTISAIQTNYIRFSAVTPTSETLNVTFYYISLPAEVEIAQPTNTSISSSSYYTTYSAWVAAAAPAVYNDAGSNYLMVKSTYSTPVIQIAQATASSTGTGTTYTETSSATQSSITTSAVTVSISTATPNYTVVLIVTVAAISLVAVVVAGTLGRANLRRRRSRKEHLQQ
jgi:hypothetical protein